MVRDPLPIALDFPSLNLNIIPICSRIIYVGVRDRQTQINRVER